MTHALPDDLHQTVQRVLREDLGDGDLTADLIPEAATVAARVVCREPMILAGRAWFDAVFHALDSSIDVQWLVEESASLPADTTLCRLLGPARPILSGERGALNLLQTLSATATVTAGYVAECLGTRCRVLDTRKTLPGLRLAQKYAVRCGGGSNHRIGLFDALLIKENHIAAAGGIRAALSMAKSLHPGKPVEIEVESIEELRTALEGRPDRVLLDNFSLAELRDAVRCNAEFGRPPAELEASGNMTLDSIRAVAETGVDFVSVGALTKNVNAIDLSMRFDPLS